MPLALRRALAATVALLCLAVPAAASAADPVDPNNRHWMPSSDGAGWSYEWWNDKHSPERTRDIFSLKSRDADTFRLNLTSIKPGNTLANLGAYMDYKRSSIGLVSTNWKTDPAPAGMPILCAASSGCLNSLSSAHFMLIWGTRSPVLMEPLVQGTKWSSTGGASNDVSSSNEYLGTERVTVKAFPEGVTAAKVRSDVTQAGAIGDPYGSGIRTVWWVYGVGPVKIEFAHTDGSEAGAELTGTNLKPLPAPSDEALLPLNRGDRMDFRWKNSKHMKRYSKQRFDVSEVVNNTARVDVKRLSGPINVNGAYVFASRLNGATNLAGVTKSASRVRFPKLASRRRFTTPFDLMSYGFNPIVPAFPKEGEVWASKETSRDFKVFGVHGTSKVVGYRAVKVPAGKFRALAVRSRLNQKGSRFGDGVRTSYFAPGEGLVKLVFRHGDRSVSKVERLR